MASACPECSRCPVPDHYGACVFCATPLDGIDVHTGPYIYRLPPVQRHSRRRPHWAQLPLLVLTALICAGGVVTVAAERDPTPPASAPLVHAQPLRFPSFGELDWNAAPVDHAAREQQQRNAASGTAKIKPRLSR